jgi:hypothetical protein
LEPDQDEIGSTYWDRSPGMKGMVLGGCHKIWTLLNPRSIEEIDAKLVLNVPEMGTLVKELRLLRRD